MRDLNQMVRPATMMTTKATIKSTAYVELLGGVVQAALGDALVDCLAENVFPPEAENELCMIVTVWLDPRCATHDALDKRDLYRTNYEAMKLAIRRAMTGEPTREQVIANRHTIRRYALEGVFD